MKKLLLGAVASVMISTPAMAQVFSATPLTSVDIELNGQVAEFCGITGATANESVDFGELAVTPVGTNVDQTTAFGLVCNSAGGIAMTVASLNGKLVRTGSNGDANNSIPYSMNPDPGSDAFQFTPGTPLQSASVFTSGKTYTTPGTAALMAGKSVDIAFRTNGVQGAGFQGAPTTTVFAGDYTDTVTVSIVAQ